MILKKEIRRGGGGTWVAGAGTFGDVERGGRGGGGYGVRCQVATEDRDPIQSIREERRGGEGIREKRGEEGRGREKRREGKRGEER